MTLALMIAVAWFTVTYAICRVLAGVNDIAASVERDEQCPSGDGK